MDIDILRSCSFSLIPSKRRNEQTLSHPRAAMHHGCTSSSSGMHDDAKICSAVERDSGPHIPRLFFASHRVIAVTTTNRRGYPAPTQSSHGIPVSQSSPFHSSKPFKPYHPLIILFPHTFPSSPFSSPSFPVSVDTDPFRSNHPPLLSSPSNSHGVTGPGLPNGPSLGLAGERDILSCAARAAASTMSRWYWRRRRRVSCVCGGGDSGDSAVEERELDEGGEEVVMSGELPVDGCEVGGEGLR